MKIEQMLHGYREGHSQLASSLYLNSLADMEKLSIMSDWTEYRDPFSEDSSYITVYYLEDSHMLVVAKTWYAYEMKRPGCVWTHSLLINLDNIESVFDFRILGSFFKRPLLNDYKDYSKPIILNKYPHLSYKGGNVNSESYKDERKIISFFLLKAQGQLVLDIERPSEDYRNLLLEILQFMPTDFLRNIYMCSGTARPRPIDQNVCALQFSLSSREQLFEVKTDVSDNDIMRTGEKFIESAMSSMDVNFTKIIRIFSSDIQRSYSHLATICYLLQTLTLTVESKEDDRNRIKIYKHLLDVIVKEFPATGDGKIIKRNFLNKRITDYYCSDSDYIVVLCSINDIKVLGDVGDLLEERLVQLISGDDDKKQYIGVLNTLSSQNSLNELGLSLISDSIRYLDDNNLRRIASEKWELFLSLYSANLQFYNRTIWLEQPKERFKQIYSLFVQNIPQDFCLWKDVVEVVFKYQIPLSERLYNKIDEHYPEIFTVLLTQINSKNYIIDSNLFEALKRWLVMEYSMFVLWLKSVDSLNETIVHLIMEIISPQGPRIKKSEMKAYAKLLSYEPKRDEQDYYSFLYILSLKDDGELSFKMLKKSFLPLHKALAEERLSEENWRKLLPYMGILPLHLEWDKCKKLRIAAVSRLLKLGYGSNIIPELVDGDEELIQMLTELWDEYNMS